MPLLTIDPSQGDPLNPPASPTPPSQTANPDPNVGATATPRSLGADQTFTPFVPKDPNDEGAASFLTKINSYMASGGKLSNLDADLLHGINTATSGDGNLTDKDVLNNPETFYQLKFKTGKYEKPILDDLGNPYKWPDLAVSFVGNAVNAVKDSVVGAYQTLEHPATAPAALSQGFEATRQFYKSLNPLNVPSPIGLVASPGFQDMARDLSDRVQKIFANDPHAREQIDRDQSEIIRNRMLRDNANSDLVAAAKYKTADFLAGIGLNDLAKATQAAQVTPEQQTFAQVITDPLTYLEFGLGKVASLATAGKVGVRFSRMEMATKALEQAAETVDNLHVQRRAFNGVTSSVGATADERLAAQRALATQAPIESRAQAVLQTAANEHQAALAVTNQELTDAATPPIGRQVVGNLAKGGGQLAEFAGKGLDWVATIPSKLVDRIFPSADETTKEVLAQTVRSKFTHALVQFGAGSVFGGPVGGLAGLLAPQATKVLQKFGRDLAMVGDQFALGQQTLPFWKSIKENTTGMTRLAASLLDNQLVYAIPDTARGAAAGAVLGGALGGIQSGGTTQGVLGGAGPGFLFGTAGGGLGQLKKFNSPAELHSAAIGDRARFIKSLAPPDQQQFGALHPAEQLAVSVYARAHPDAHISFFTDPSPGAPNGSHTVVNGRGAISINSAGDNPIEAILAHEVGHHIASHGLGATVEDYMLGNVAKGQPGIFTKYDQNGVPLVETGPDGIQRYVPNNEFEGYKAKYNTRKGAIAGAIPEDNYGIAQEMFAELHAAKYHSPADVQKLVRGFVPSGLAGDNVAANWFTRMGMGTDASGRPLSTDTVKQTRGLNDVVDNFYRDRSYKTNPPEDDRGYTRVPVGETRRGTPEFDRLAKTFDASGDLKRNPDGTIWTGRDGRPQIVSVKEADATHGKMTDAVISMYKNNPTLEGAGGDNSLRLVTYRNGRKVYRGQTVPPQVLDALAASNQHNPAQINNWRTLNGVMGRNDGTMVLQVYNTAGKRGAYATLPAKERAVVPLYTEVSPATRQTNVQAYDPEQMTSNIARMLRTKKGKEIWDGKIAPAHDDVKTYLDNLSNNRPGETGIGLQKKGAINELFGINADANPYVTEVMKRSPSVFKTFRLDRINRLQELPGTIEPVGAQTYEQVYGFMQPKGMQTEASALDRTAIPVTMRTTRTGKTEPAKIDYSITKAPLVADKQPPADLPKGANNFGHLDFLTKPDQQKLTHLDEASAVTSFADKLVGEYGQWTGNRDVMKAKRWYGEVRGYLKKAVGPDAELFAHLLAATSPQQGVVQNWHDAKTAYERYKMGYFDDAIAKYKETGKITEDMKPRKENGALFATNSDAVLKVLSGTWLDSVEGPKTPNFFDNLFGRGTRATIDKWAARTMRRLGYEGVPGAPEQYRLQPKSEMGVNNLDFAFSQEAFGQAADRLGMDAHQLQAILWYAEKHHWVERGYSKGGAAAAKASYIPMLKEYAGQQAAVRQTASAAP